MLVAVVPKRVGQNCHGVVRGPVADGTIGIQRKRLVADDQRVAAPAGGAADVQRAEAAQVQVALAGGVGQNQAGVPAVHHDAAHIGHQRAGVERQHIAGADAVGQGAVQHVPGRAREHIHAVVGRAAANGHAATAPEIGVGDIHHIVPTACGPVDLATSLLPHHNRAIGNDAHIAEAAHIVEVADGTVALPNRAHIHSAAEELAAVADRQAITIGSDIGTAAGRGGDTHRANIRHDPAVDRDHIAGVGGGDRQALRLHVPDGIAQHRNAVGIHPDRGAAQVHSEGPEIRIGHRHRIEGAADAAVGEGDGTVGNGADRAETADVVGVVVDCTAAVAVVGESDVAAVELAAVANRQAVAVGRVATGSGVTDIKRPGIRDDAAVDDQHIAGAGAGAGAGPHGADIGQHVPNRVGQHRDRVRRGTAHADAQCPTEDRGVGHGHLVEAGTAGAEGDRTVEDGDRRHAATNLVKIIAGTAGADRYGTAVPLAAIVDDQAVAKVGQATAAADRDRAIGDIRDGAAVDNQQVAGRGADANSDGQGASIPDRVGQNRRDVIGRPVADGERATAQHPSVGDGHGVEAGAGAADGERTQRHGATAEDVQGVAGRAGGVAEGEAAVHGAAVADHHPVADGRGAGADGDVAANLAAVGQGEDIVRGHGVANGEAVDVRPERARAGDEQVGQAVDAVAIEECRAGVDHQAVAQGDRVTRAQRVIIAQRQRAAGVDDDRANKAVRAEQDRVAAALFGEPVGTGNGAG